MKVVYFPALTLKAKLIVVRVWEGVGRADAKMGGRGGMGFSARKRVALPKYVNE